MLKAKVDKNQCSLGLPSILCLLVLQSHKLKEGNFQAVLG